MRLLIALNETMPPQQTGGSQKVAFEIAAGLMRLGDEAMVVGKVDPRRLSGVPAVVRGLISRQFYVAERTFGVQSARFFKEDWSFPALLKSVRPDLVLIHAMSAMPLAHMVSDLNIPLVIYWHDVEFHRLRGSPDGIKAHFIANSKFTAAKVVQRFRRKVTVMPPIFAPPPIGQEPVARENVLFINPVPEKGVDLALEIARLCPDIRFEFLENWAVESSQHQRLRASVRDQANVVLTKRQSQMGQVYARAKVLIAPSRWEEAWGRVATEAHANGLPVFATRIGGLPESVGPGGLLFDPVAGAAEWAAALRRVWGDPAEYARLAAATESYAKRPEVDPEVNLTRLRALFHSALEQG